MNRPTLRRIVAVSWLLFSVIPAALADQPSPLPNTSVHDFAGVISDDKKAEIQSKSQRLKDEYKTEIAVVTINSLEGEDVFDYSMKMARSWGIGSKDNDIRGLLILVAINERKTAFRTSRHIEGEIPDAVTAEISKAMNALFKSGDFGGGLSVGMDKILERMQMVYESPSQQNSSSSNGLGWLWALIIGLPAALAGSVLLWKRKKRRERRLAEQESARRRAELARIAAARAAPKPQGKQKKGKAARSGKRKSGARGSSYSPSYESSSSSSSSSYDSGSSSSYDSGSSYSYDSGSSYSGGSDFGGGGSDSSW